MISGREAWHTIDQSVRQAQAEAAAIDREIAALTERRLRLHEMEGEAARELAMFRLKQPAEGGLAAALSAVERRARDLLARRAEAVRALDERIAECEAEGARLAEDREARMGEIEALRAAYLAAEEAAMARLGGTADYQEQARRAEAAARMAAHAGEKARFAAEDRENKGRPYQRDPLFMYLWQRGYGTSAYDGGALTRLFDRRVARLIGFDKARANYAMLQEIPRRLQAHAEREEAQARAEAQKLDDMEAAALRDSEAAAAAARLAGAEKALAELDAKIAGVEQRTDELSDRRAELTSGEDAETKAAISDLAARLQSAEIRELRKEARLTPLPDDDEIVERIAAAEADLEALERELAQARERQLEQRRRLRELERIRREYRRASHDVDSWDFGDANMLSVLIFQLLAGILTRDDFWGQMNRRRGRTIGGLPGGRPGGFPGRPRGRGGFRTTGRMGRGGFRTTDSF